MVRQLTLICCLVMSTSPWFGALISLVDAAEMRPGTIGRGPDGNITVVPHSRESGPKEYSLPKRIWSPSKEEVGGQRLNVSQAGKVVPEPSTPHSLALRWPIQGDHNGNATVEVAYRRAGERAWRTGFPLFWVHPDGAKSAGNWRREIAEEKGRRARVTGTGPYPRVPGGRLFAGSIVDLAPDTAYDVRLDLIDADGGSEQRLLPMRTSAEPVLPAVMRVRHVIAAPEAVGRAGSGTADDPFRGLAPAARAARPGDLFLLRPGTYRVGTLKPTRSGDPGKPIVFRGVNGPVVLDGGGGPTLIDAAGLRHVWFEHLTLGNADVLIQARMASHIVVRGNRFILSRKKLAAGFVARDADYGESRGFFITDNAFIGPNTWPRAQLAKGLGEFIFAIAITGSGHVVAFNRIRNVGDGLNNGGGGFLSASDIHNNDIDAATDDCIEADHSATNLRVFRNRLTNCFAGISAQPIHGGPAYVFRNRILNTQYSPFKLHNHTSGLLLFHNTSVRSGIPFHIQPGRETVNDVVTRNNLFIGTDGPALRSTGRMLRCDFDNDGYGWDRGGFALWNQRRYPSPLAARDGGGPYARLGAVMLHPGGTFANGLAAAQDDRKRRDPAANDPRLAPGSRAVDGGVALPNFNDGIHGAAPDLGCCERGSPLPHVGPRPGKGPG
jgi:hypothetical protein